MRPRNLLLGTPSSIRVYERMLQLWSPAPACARKLTIYRAILVVCRQAWSAYICQCKQVTVVTSDNSRTMQYSVPQVRVMAYYLLVARSLGSRVTTRPVTIARAVVRPGMVAIASGCLNPHAMWSPLFTHSFNTHTFIHTYIHTHIHIHAMIL